MGPAALAAVAAVPELFKIGAGLMYGAQSKKYARTPRPAYEIPQAMKDYLAATKFEAGKYGLPGQGQIEAKLGRQTAASTRAIQQSGQSAASQLGAIAALDQQTKQSVADLGVEAARFKAARQNEMYGAQQAMAVEQGRQWQWDKQQPYLNAMNTAARLQQAGTQGVFMGLEGLSGIFTNLMSPDAKELLGGKKADTTEGGAAAPTGSLFTSKIAQPSYAQGLMAPDYGEDYPLTGGASDMGTVELPSELSNVWQSNYYGTNIDQQTQDYYGMGNIFNNLFSNIFRPRGSSRTYTRTRR